MIHVFCPYVRTHDLYTSQFTCVPITFAMYVRVLSLHNQKNAQMCVRTKAVHNSMNAQYALTFSKRYHTITMFAQQSR